MREKYLNKEVFIRQKNGKQIVGKILYWVEEQGEREYILINDECIYADEIEFIELKDEYDFIRHFNKNVKIEKFRILSKLFERKLRMENY